MKILETVIDEESSTTKSVDGSPEVWTFDTDKSRCCFDNEVVKESIRLVATFSFPCGTRLRRH